MVDQKTTGFWSQRVVGLLVVSVMTGGLSSADAREMPSTKPIDTNHIGSGQTLNHQENWSTDLQDVKEQLKRFEDKERQDYLLVLEGQRKTIDWWFSYLAVITAVLAVFGALIPFLMGRKDKESI